MSAPGGAGEWAIPPAPGWPGAFWATKKASTHGRTGEARAPTGDRAAHALRRSGKRTLALALSEKLRLCPVEGRPDAETEHPTQQKDLRLPRRLPGAAGPVPGGVGPAVGGDRPPSRHRVRVIAVNDVGTSDRSNLAYGTPGEGSDSYGVLE